MRKLSKEEAEKIRTRPSGRSSPTRTYLLGMTVGDIIFLERRDWTQKKRLPSTFCSDLARKTGRSWKCDTAIDNSGWVIERLK